MTPLAAVDKDIGNALSELSQVLAVPVLAAAAVIVVLAAVELGRWMAEAVRRRRARLPLSRITAQLVQEPHATRRLAAAAPSVYAGATLERIGEALDGHRPGEVEHALDDYEHLVERRLDTTRMLVRAGPAVGLMGTLIPLAPGLKALGGGDVQLLADDLRIAFAATVAGLLAGTVAFALTLVRTRRWNEDLAAMERATAHVRAVAAAAAQARADAEGRALVDAERETVA